MTEKLSLPSLLRRGDVYWLDPLEVFTQCPHGHEFLHLFRVDYSAKCPKCHVEFNPTEHVQRGKRPFIVIQEPSFIETTRMVIVIPMTSSSERWIQQLPGTIAINLHSELKLKERFPTALVYQVRAIDVRCFLQENFAGRVLDSDLQRVDKKLKEILAL